MLGSREPNSQETPYLFTVFVCGIGNGNWYNHLYSGLSQSLAKVVPSMDKAADRRRMAENAIPKWKCLLPVGEVGRKGMPSLLAMVTMILLNAAAQMCVPTYTLIQQHRY